MRSKHENLVELKFSENGILVYTDGWGVTAFKIKTLQFVSFKKSADYQRQSTTLKEIDVTQCSRQELAMFFKEAAKLSVNASLNPDITHTQFACVLESPPDACDSGFPMKWFWISIEGKPYTISHDVAFDTVLVSKNFDKTSLQIALGGFRRARKYKYKHAKSKQAAQSYKTIANLIMKRY